MSRHPAKTHDRPRGHIMVSSALLLFALFGLLGLVVDLGRARVELRSLEASAEFGAREVVRLRGEASLPDEVARREYVSQRLYNLSATITTQRAATSRGEGEYDVQYDEQGFAVVDVAAGAWHPELQPNPDNEWAGDFVGGSYDAWEVHDSGQHHCEGEMSSHFCRKDFAPAEPLASGASTLVHVRRSRTPWVEEVEPDVASSGPGLSTVLAWSPLTHERPDAEVDDGPVPGANLRASAIAGLRPVVQVGPAFPGTLGSCTLAMKHSCWARFADDATIDLVVEDDYLTLRGDEEPCAIFLGESQARSVGQALMHHDVGAQRIANEGTCWLALLLDGPNGAFGFVAGFARAVIDWNWPAAVLVERKPAGVAATNASALWPRARPWLDAATIAAVLQHQTGRNDLLMAAVVQR